ncbi:uncharacterized protein LOC111651121 isoform X2 [Seriola lalandi dorsalis]|uniref:uncharacterized protein LOC111651121 isoform X2 n=1 Tax=Seriola lalandi dorsalis TaxID=1841481 RepID=UPI000C6F8CCF|nr:uncharacterized protein LOC111651121 isoform X2 [Seriola lalandi dorsalis]
MLELLQCLFGNAVNNINQEHIIMFDCTTQLPALVTSFFCTMARGMFLQQININRRGVTVSWMIVVGLFWINSYNYYEVLPHLIICISVREEAGDRRPRTLQCIILELLQRLFVNAVNNINQEHIIMFCCTTLLPALVTSFYYAMAAFWTFVQHVRLNDEFEPQININGLEFTVSWRRVVCLLWNNNYTYYELIDHLIRCISVREEAGDRRPRNLFYIICERLRELLRHLFVNVNNINE